MKPALNLALALVLSISAPLLAQKPQPIPKNASRLALDAYIDAIYKAVGDSSEKQPETALPKPRFKLGKEWKPQYAVSRDDSAMIIRFSPTGEFLEFGQASVFITTTPFNLTLREAPNVLDNGAAIEFEVQRWLPQKWQKLTIPALNGIKVHGYQESQSGGADNARHSTVPFSVKTKSGKTYWLVVQADEGYHKTRGMTLQRALNALTFK